MSFEAMTWALRQPVGGNEKLVLILIANRIHPDQGFCWPKIDTITEEAGISYSTVQRCIGRLIESGLITTQRTHNQDGYLGGYRFYMADDRISPKWREFSRTGQNDRSSPTGQNDLANRSNCDLGTGHFDRTKTVRRNNKGNSKPPIVPKSPKPKIPDWIPIEAWNGFLEMRASIKKPLKTDRAVTLIVNKLDKLRQQGNAPGDVLDQSTGNSWQGVFAIHEDFAAKRQERRMGDQVGFQKVTDNWGLTGYDLDANAERLRDLEQ